MLRAILAALLFAIPGQAHAQMTCGSTTWIDDFTEVPVERIESLQGVSVDNRQFFANGVQRRDETKGWPVPAGAPAGVTIRQVMEPSSTAPMTCFMAAQLFGSTVDGPNQYCRSLYYDPFGQPDYSIPLNGATHWYMITDHIGNDGFTDIRGSNINGSSQPVSKMRHGFASKATVWTAPIHPNHIADGRIYLPITILWDPRVPTVGTPMPQSRWGILRFGIGPAEGACIPFNGQPAQGPAPGTAYSALERNGAELFDQEGWQGNGRTCDNCHNPAEQFQFNPTSLELAHPLLWSQLGEDPDHTEATTEVLAHSDGFLAPPLLLQPSSLLAVGDDPNFGIRHQITDLSDFAATAIADHMAFTSSRVTARDFRAATEWEATALASYIEAIPPVCEPCACDFDNNGSVGIADRNILNMQFGVTGKVPCEGSGECTGDTDVGIADYTKLNMSFGNTDGCIE